MVMRLWGEWRVWSDRTASCILFLFYMMRWMKGNDQYRWKRIKTVTDGLHVEKAAIESGKEVTSVMHF